MSRERKPARRVPASRVGSAEILGANSEIARKLGEYYEELVSHEIPERFVELLTQLERAQTAAKKD
jgi:hypothetical protein